MHSLFSGKDRDLKIQRQRVLYRGLTIYEGDELIYHIQNWLSQNTVRSQFNLSDATENFAHFEQVRIPLAKKNMALDARGFVRELQKYLQQNPYSITSKIIMQGLGKATLIIGEK